MCCMYIHTTHIQENIKVNITSALTHRLHYERIEPAALCTVPRELPTATPSSTVYTRERGVGKSWKMRESRTGADKNIYISRNKTNVNLNLAINNDNNNNNNKLIKDDVIELIIYINTEKNMIILSFN